MTKARKIFEDTYCECRRHIKVWGYDGVGFNRMATEETVCTRTINEIQKHIDREYKDLQRDAQFMDAERVQFLQNALNMTQMTLNNVRESERKFKEWLKTDIH